MDVTMAVAARQALRKGLNGSAAEAAVEKTLAPLQKEMEHLLEMRAEVLAWQAEAETAEARAKDLRSLAEATCNRLDDTLSPERRQDFMSALNIKITLTGPPPPPPRKGMACPVGKWFKDNGRLVPKFSDELWLAVEDAVPVMPGPSARTLLEAFLCKARCGAPWPQLGARFGSSRLRLYWGRWQAFGLWERVMERLGGWDGVPPAEPPQLPSMIMEGDIRPGVILAVSESRFEEQAPSGSACCS